MPTANSLQNLPYDAHQLDAGCDRGSTGTMLIAEILPEAMKLPRHERFRLAQLLLEDLTAEELTEHFRDGQVFPIYTPTYAPDAACVLARALAQEGVE